EFFFDQAYFPRLVFTAEIFKVVVTIDVDQIIFKVTGAISLLFKPVVEFIVIDLVHGPPKHQHSVALWVGSIDHAYTTYQIDVLHSEAQQPIEGFDEINIHQLRFSLTLNLQLVLVRITETFRI